MRQREKQIGINRQRDGYRKTPKERKREKEGKRISMCERD